MPEPLPVSSNTLRYHSELFTVRLWREQIDDHFEWRGKVQHVLSGETRYFRDWDTLIACLQDMLTTSEVSGDLVRIA